MTTPATIHGLELPKQDPANHIYFIGVDEVARGCLAGPVVACAMCLDITRIQATLASQTFTVGMGLQSHASGTPVPRNSHPLGVGLELSVDGIPKICDSKKLTPKNRALAKCWILDHALSHAIGQASVTEIDTFNIREATFLAMNRALVDCIAGLRIPDISLATVNIVIDGNAFKIMPGFEVHLSGPNIKITTLIKGDAHDITIASASIIAKETRDMLLDELVVNEPSLTKYNWHNNRAYGTAEHIRLIREHGISQHHRRTFLKKILP